ncbi:membrane protein [Xenorhabdus sp. TS4]|nr:membrane protein [Xenorhabdus sp. TS4]
MITSDDSQALFLPFCVFLITLFLSTACSWFAPALIILKDFSVGKSLSISLSAIWKNLLGVLFTIPLNLATSYISYCSVFYKKETQKDDVTVTS